MFLYSATPRYPGVMPNAHAFPHRAHLKQEILTRVAAGETVRGICAGAGMPCEASVQVWRRADAGFAADLAAARRRGDWMRRLAFDEAVAAAFLARVAAGEGINTLLGRPGMPSQGTYRHWRRTQVGFAGDLWAIRQAREQIRLRGLKGRYRGFDQAVADRVLVAVARGANLRRLLETDPSLPCRAVLYRWREAEPGWDRALRTAMGVGRRARDRAQSLAACTLELTAEIGERIAMGVSLRSLAAEPGMPSAATLYAWVAKSPAFAAEVARAGDWREEVLADQMLDICGRDGPLGLEAARAAAASLRLRVNQLAKRPGWKRCRL
jgi:terminase small subunit-like protein